MAAVVKDIVTPVRLEYTMIAGMAQKRFLRGLATGRILAQRCPSCRQVYIPPRGSCPTCAVATAEEVEVSDKGTITTFCIVDLPFYGQAVEIPYVCASILEDQGSREQTVPGNNGSLWHIPDTRLDGRGVQRALDRCR